MSYFIFEPDKSDKELYADYDGIKRVKNGQKPETIGEIEGVYVIIVGSKPSEESFSRFGIPFKSINITTLSETIQKLKYEVFSSDKLYTMIIISDNIALPSHPSDLLDKMVSTKKKAIMSYSSKKNGCKPCIEAEKAAGMEGSVGKSIICENMFAKNVLRILAGNLNRIEFRDKHGHISMHNMLRYIWMTNQPLISVDANGEIFSNFSKLSGESFKVNINRAVKREAQPAIKQAGELIKVMAMSQFKRLKGETLTNQEIQDRRIACKGGGKDGAPACPKYLPNKGDKWCAMCTCNMESKVTFIGSTCKVGRWKK